MINTKKIKVALDWVKKFNIYLVTKSKKKQTKV